MNKKSIIAAISAVVILASCGGNAVKTEDAQAAAQSADSARTFTLDSTASKLELQVNTTEPCLLSRAS
jgi:peptidoglycan hydrolase CwlO-like protein